MTTYNFTSPGLAESVAAAPITKGHVALLQRIRGFDGLENAVLATTRGDSWYARRKVLDAAGMLVHDDHEAWLQLQLEADGGRVRATRDRLRAQKYFLTKCGLTTLYIVHDRRTANQADFVQVKVMVESEVVDCELFSDSGWRTLEDLSDLVRDSEGIELKEKRQFRPIAYCLDRSVDVGLFMVELENVEAARREASRARRFKLTHGNTGRQEVVTMDVLSPSWDKFPARERRLFDDWGRSSAGRSGARFCDHWAAQLSDYTDPKGERWMSFVPLWTTTKKLAKIEGNKGGVYELFGKLEKMNLRLDVPFGWFFYMLHGNRMGDVVGRRIVQAAEDGLIVLPEHDYQVLASWKSQEYGF